MSRTLKSRDGTIVVPSTETLQLDATLSGAAIDTDLSTTSASDDTLASAKAVKAYVDGKAGYNYIINGGMRVSQRGDFTSATAMTSSVYYLDRFQANITASSTIQHILNSSDSLHPKLGSAKLNCTVGGTGLLLRIRQNIEDFVALAGRTVVVSIRVKTLSSNVRIRLTDGVSNSVSSAATGSGSWETLTLLKNMSSSATIAQFYAGIQGATGGSISIATNENFEIGAVKLEIGSVATPFTPRLIGEELALCQRYYWQIDSSSANTKSISTGFAVTTTILRSSVISPVSMYSTPTITSSGSLEIKGNGTSITFSSIAPIASTHDHNIIFLSVNTSTTMVTNEIYSLISNNSDTLLTFESEL